MSDDILEQAGWNPAPTPYPNDRCVHELFEAHAARQPNQIALVEGEKQWSYRDLDEQANQLAHQLRALGVGPETRVGVYMERSALMVMGFLAILKAGGAYVPLDPIYPTERVAWMLADTQAPVVLTQTSLLESLPVGDTQRLCLDATGTKQWPTHAPPRQCFPSYAAHVIYTSGSTGKPKGVIIPHSAINRTVVGSNYLQLGPDDCVAHVANTSFDAATFEIWGALLNGARLVIVSREQLLAPEDFATLLRTEAVTTLLLTTSLFNQLAYAHPSLFSGLHTVLFGGEAANPRAARHLLDSAPPQRLLNLYGPTESTVLASWYEVKAIANEATSLPIGLPVSNTVLYVLDETLQPLPVGVPGELYLGGEGLARGYLNRPALTAASFIPDPFSGVHGARLYRTGDLVRSLPDGQLDFVERKDQQVKLRGFRIELGEIESALSRHPAIREAVVIVREDTPGHRYLASYLTLNEESTPTTSEMRAFLQERLPSYMVPSAFVFLPALPLTPNGKFDPRALPIPDQDTRTELFVAPRTPLEELLATLFAELLEVEQVSIHDNFFDLGGHSLLAMQALTRSAQHFQVSLPVSTFFKAPTVAGLAAAIAHSPTTQALPLLPIPRTDQMPLSYAQQRLWFLDQMMPESPVYNVPFAIRLRGALDHPALEQSLTEMVRRHEALRSTFGEQNGRPYCRIHPAGARALTVEELGHLPDSEQAPVVQQRIREDARAPFNLAQGPLLRTHLLRLRPDEHILLLNVHHIVADGWSVGVFSNELVALYDAFCQKQSSPLPELSIQYVDFAQWQRQWLEGGHLDAMLPYWKEQLAQAPAALDLPIDRPRPPLQTFEGALYPLVVDKSMTEALKILSRREDSTLFMTLLATFQLMLHRYSGQNHINVGTPIANRNRTEIEGLIGFFVNTLVISTELGGDPSFRELLQRVRRLTLDAYDHQDVPFDKIVEALQAGRDQSRSPLFQVMFVLQNAPLGEQSLAGVSMEVLPTEAGIAKFDLILSFVEQEGKLVGSIEYNSALFEVQSIERMADHLRVLLGQIIAAPEQPLSAFLVLTPAEQAELTRKRAQARQQPQPPTGKEEKESAEEMQARVASRKDQLSAKKQALLEKMLRRAVEEPAAQAPTIPQRPTDTPIPLSFSQEQLWFLDQLAPGMATYNMPFRMEFTGPLSAQALTQSFTELLRRHEALRTYFEGEEVGRVVQKITPPTAFPVTIIDLRDLADGNQSEEVERLSAEDAARPFDLTHPPLLRATLLQLSESRHLLLLTLHHIIFDGWSLALLVRELGAIYQAVTRGMTPPLPPLLVQYPDYAFWQRDMFQNGTMQAQLDYWKKQLAAHMPVLELPTDHPRPPVQRYRGTLYTFHLPRTLTDRLNALGKQEGCTLFMTTLSLFKGLLHRYT
ncbi:MAG: amino acid adenylation domain-containing protein, partial [Ardenticatenales bacterium]|nr:amino acid adenylation domain-containing protein [Ardenticatenales bacterium]